MENRESGNAQKIRVKIEILDEAQHDLLDGSHFYNRIEVGLGAYFFDSLLSDIDSLEIYAGIHPMVFDYYRCLSKRFPFAIFMSFKPGWFRSTRCSIVAGVLRGFGNAYNGRVN